MKIIISPAKKMRTQDDIFLPSTQPVFLKQTEVLLQKLQTFSEEELKILFRANEQISHQNYIRYQHMDLFHHLTPAVLSYIGIQYQYMAPQVFTDKQWDYVMEHLQILSGFYGILKAGDGITPYRLEMQAKLSIGSNKNLYQFWGKRLYEELVKDDSVILNLASKEYSKCIEPYLDHNIQYISCIFGSCQNGTIKGKATEIKMVRGEMVRWLSEHQITDIEKIKQFDGMGYQYDPKYSTETQWVFLKQISSAPFSPLF